MARASVRCVVLGILALSPPLMAAAQEMTYLGTVVTLEAGRVQVKTIDEPTKKEGLVWFVIDKNTKVKRGEQIVVLSAAKIAPGERIAVLVDPASKTQMLAAEIRLAPPSTPKAATPAAQKPATPAAPDPHAAHQPEAQKPMPAMQMSMAPAGWQLMQDGVVYGLFNRQGGPRGDEEFVVPNWWMGMLMRERGAHQFGLNAMFSLDAATVGKSGYAEIFQAGEALDGKPLIDRQHPHDLFMQLAGSWRWQPNERTALAIAGGPAGEPTLGPVAFMHRGSAAGLVLAPLGHHTFDSTHITFGVVTASLERGRWTFEGSAFNGREPDEERWDFDFAAMDSIAGRVWFRPTDAWELQVSTSRLREPEELVAGDVTRSTASASWFREREDGFRAMTLGYGVNAEHGERRQGGFGEATVERGSNALFGRVELQQVEMTVLITGDVPDEAEEGAPASTVGAFTLGATRRLFEWKGFEGALGGQVTFYRVPELLKVTHGSNPASFQLFFRLRLPTGSMGRMWNMRMSQGHKMDMKHAGHEMR